MLVPIYYVQTLADELIVQARKTVQTPPHAEGVPNRRGRLEPEETRRRAADINR